MRPIRGRELHAHPSGKYGTMCLLQYFANGTVSAAFCSVVPTFLFQKYRLIFLGRFEYV